MGRVNMSGSGSGADLDVITATAGDVLAGKVIVDKDGNPLTGTIPNRGAVNQSLAINGSYTIPKGYHNGSGKVTQSVPTQGAKTITPGASQQQVAAGRYLTGAITVPGFSMPAANLIKKGAKITIYGRSVTGTFEGYVATSLDIYNRGAWGSGYSLNNLVAKTYSSAASGSPPSISQDSSNIILTGRNDGSTGGFIINKAINISPYRTLNVVFRGSAGTAAAHNIGLCLPDFSKINITGIIEYAEELLSNVEETITLDVSNLNQDAYVFFRCTSSYWLSDSGDRTYVSRIYFE